MMMMIKMKTLLLDQTKVRRPRGEEPKSQSHPGSHPPLRKPPKFTQPPRPPTTDRCPLDLSKPLPLKGHPGHLTVASEYFFNNNLKYLKSSDPEKKHTMSITKTKAARYKLVGIKDMIPSLWSETKVSYDKDVERGIRHWGPKRQLFYRSQINKFLKHDVYLTQKILSVVSVKGNKLHGVVYEDLNKKKRVMRVDELYKFSDGTLKLVCNELHHKILNFCLGFNKEMSRRKWSVIEKRRSKLMVELIDKHMRERRILRNLERLVGARELEMDYRLMKRIV
ncbi:hypothetical protein Tco_0662212 [Tanacetum coccineum]